jgi:alanine racemase
MGVIGYKNSHFNMVRPGLVIYGLYPKKHLKIKLRPALSLKTKALFIKRLPKGYGVSYGHDYVTKKNTTIITLPIGYGDGYPRNLSNCAPVLIGEKRFKISGRICMDQLMVDVGDFKVRVGDEAVLIGSQGKDKITAEELAALSDTIPYEIVCGLGSRVPRLYV